MDFHASIVFVVIMLISSEDKWRGLFSLYNYDNELYIRSFLFGLCFQFLWLFRMGY